MSKKHFAVLCLFFPISSFGVIKVAITVDDLPLHSHLPPGISRQDIARKMVASLKEANIGPVYGFINAEKNDLDPSLNEVLKIWTEAGNPLGNHTYSHKSLNEVNVAEFQQEIDRNEDTLKKFNKNANWHFFRYPFLHEGNTLEKRNKIRHYLNKKNYKIAEVTVDFEDWVWNASYVRCLSKHDMKSIEWLRKSFVENAVAGLERAQEVSNILFKRPIPHVLLLHIGAFDAEMLTPLIKAYRAHGVEFESLESIEKDEVYSLNPQVTSDSGNELIYQVMMERRLKSKDLSLKTRVEYRAKALAQLCQ